MIRWIERTDIFRDDADRVGCVTRPAATFRLARCGAHGRAISFPERGGKACILSPLTAARVRPPANHGQGGRKRMRINTTKRLLKAGKPAIGTWLNLPCVNSAEILAHAGWD